MAIQHHSAIAEKRRAARSVCAPPRSAWTTRASNPPAHRLAATRWISRLLVARSCEPPADEWPVNPSGTSVTNDPTNSNGVHDQRSTARLANVTRAAKNAVQRHAEAVLIRPATDQSCTGFRWAANG